MPKHFCWTRFGTEAAQPVKSILERKERERLANGGVFLWGVGNAIGPSIKELLRREPTPEILFSPIKSRPRLADVLPPAVVAWASGEMLDGSAFCLPVHSLVTSRYDPDAPRASHYALVCATSQPLTEQPQTTESISFGRLRNLLSGRQLGASQVTAVVQCIDDSERGATYDVAFRAGLVAPYFIRLRAPVWLPKLESSHDWVGTAFQLVQERARSAGLGKQLPLLTSLI